MKILAMYLPQFHKVKENDEWWGEGFTDWISTRNAKPICEDHYQPHIPLGENYYDLMNPDTLKWQADLMKKYGVDGLCFYHYYFKDGRKILERPAELLLDNSDIDMPFCFYWANESWKRSWSNVPNANVWNMEAATENKSNGNGLLLDQQYGELDDWIEHFNYMLPFFLDDRYIKVDGKPLFLIYRTSQIPCLESMITCFREQAKKHGFPDIYIIGAYAKKSSLEFLDGFLYHEPPQTLSSFRGGGVGETEYSISYDRIIESVLAEPVVSGVDTYFSCFTGFDDTPRRGKKGNALIDATPSKYQTFLAKTMAKNEVAGNDITFVNAWNEWGEGMHLEPDQKYEFGFLEATKNAKNMYKTFLESERSQLFDSSKENFQYLQEKADKFEYYVNIFHRWMELRENGISICDYLRKYNLNTVAIYGLGMFGKHLYWELTNKGMDVSYIIDRQGSSLDPNLTIYLPEDDFPECDVIIVTPFWIYDQIKKVLGDGKNIIPLDEIICNIQ